MLLYVKEKTSYASICKGEDQQCFYMLRRPAMLSTLDKLLGQLGIYATWLSSIAFLQKQLRIFFFKKIAIF